MESRSQEALRVAFDDLAAGELRALETIYDLAAADLYGFAVWKTGNADTAADLLQDVFVRLATRRESLGKVKRARSYLFAMLSRAAIDVSRRRARWRESDEELAFLEADLPQADRRLDAERIRRWLSRLPSAQREALYLRYFAGLGFREIGRACGVSTFTAASRCRLGIRRLRSYMGVNDETGT